jgi:hypothetical protein
MTGCHECPAQTKDCVAEQRSRASGEACPEPVEGSKSAMLAGLSAFDSPFDKLRVRSGRTGRASTAGEEVYQSSVV